MTIENAFAESRNIPALKLAAHVGIHKVIEMAHRFGVTSSIPPFLPVALGAVEITLEEQVASYSVFPNDGLRVAPHLIRKVSNADGITLFEDRPAVNQVIDQQTARTMMILLRDVTQHGTGAEAAQLNHPLGGKTGTTSDFTDAWFLGFSPSVTCGVWIGFDSRESLGEKETGARAALPIWMTFMRAAIAGKTGEQFPGDGQNGQPLQASAAPSSAPTSSTGASIASTRQSRSASTVRIASRPPSTMPGTILPPAPSGKPTVKPASAAGSAAARQVRPALPQPSAPVAPRAIVKPAFDNPRP